MSKNLSTLSRYVLEQFLDGQGQTLKSGKLTPPDNLVAEKNELVSIEDVQCLSQTHGIRSAYFSMTNSWYFCFAVESEQDEIGAFDEIPNDFCPIDLTAATHLHFIYTLKLSAKVKRSDDVEQRIIGPSISDDGVDVYEVLKFFPKLYFFQFRNTGNFHATATPNVILTYLASFHPCIVNRCILEQESADSIRELLLEGKTWLQKDNVFDAMTASHLRHSFLEIYRCLEFAFVLPKAKALMKSILLSGGSVSEDPLEFAKRCVDTLGWRRIERDSITSIFTELVNQDHTAFFAEMAACPVTKPTQIPLAHETENLKNAVSAAAQNYYSVRNQVAHQFWPNQMRVMQESDWNSIIKLTAYCVKNYH